MTGAGLDREIRMLVFVRLWCRVLGARQRERRVYSYVKED